MILGVMIAYFFLEYAVTRYSEASTTLVTNALPQSAAVLAFVHVFQGARVS